MIYEAIDYWNSSDPYLEHHGVKGMKWGVRKAYHNFQANRHRKAAARIQKDIDSFKGHENGIQTKSGRQLLTSKDVNDSIKGLKTVQKRHLEKAKQHENYQPKGLTKGQKIAIGVGVGAAAAVGVGVGAYILKKNGMLPISKVPKVKMNLANSPYLKKRMSVSVATIKKGPSTIQKNVWGKRLVSPSQQHYVNDLAGDAKRASRNMYASPTEKVQFLNRARSLGEDEIVRNGVGYYRPRQITRSGRKVGRLVKLTNGKTSYWSR